jgi:hypothetical protein
MGSVQPVRTGRVTGRVRIKNPSVKCGLGRVGRVQGVKGGVTHRADLLIPGLRLDRHFCPGLSGFVRDNLERTTPNYS